MDDFSDLRIAPARLLEDIDALAGIGVDAENGRTRPSYSPAYNQAVDWLIGAMRAAGLQARVDAVGNVIGRMGPDKGQIVMTGSHIDTVRNGGPLDGAYGVIAGLEVARVLKEHKVPLDVPFEVTAFADEEGAYFSLLGSRAIAGQLQQGDIRNAVDWRGKRLAEAMAEQGLTPDEYERAAYPKDAVSAYVELHIEQGPVLDRLGLDIGVVSGIVGMQNIDYRFFGASNHAGTTPMDMRKDALRAAADFISSAYETKWKDTDPSTRMTFGAIEVKPNASNVIPRECVVRLDCRDLDDSRLGRLCRSISKLACDVAHKHGVRVEVEEKSQNLSARTAQPMMARIQGSADKLGYTSRVMPSGAGHDTQSMALCCDTGMIFVPSKSGLSHHPDEWTEPDQLVKGANVLLQTVLALVTPDQVGLDGN